MDAFLNVVFYMPLGVAAFVAIRRKGAVAVVAALAFGTLVSFTVEWAQFYIPGRVSSWNDLLSNSAGTLLGIAVAFAATSPPLAPRLRTLNTPIVFAAWTLGGLAGFHVLAPIRAGAGSQPRDCRIAGAGFTGRLAGNSEWRRFYCLIWLVMDELWPFQFQGPPQPFWWLPFEGWFAGSFDAYYGILFGKLFLYTAILWAERRSGMRWIWALAAPGAILFAGELAQRYLPGRTPEITDLVLLAAGAVLLNLAESSESLG